MLQCVQLPQRYRCPIIDTLEELHFQLLALDGVRDVGKMVKVAHRSK